MKQEVINQKAISGISIVEAGSNKPDKHCRYII